MTETCRAASEDDTRCDRPKGHYGNQHDGPIKLTAAGGINQWRWPA